MHKIQIEVQFRAGHRLIEPYKGKCNNVHGEGYTAIIEFESRALNKDGMVIDFGKAKSKIKEWIDENWDHAYLYKERDEVGEWLSYKRYKTFFFDENPTAEYMAQYLYDEIKIMNLPVIGVGIVESFRDSIAYYDTSKN